MKYAIQERTPIHDMGFEQVGKQAQAMSLANYNLFLEEKKRKRTTLETKELEQWTDTVAMKFCALHPAEPIKYFCRDEWLGICSECIVHHAKHDFVFADSAAAEEVAGVLHGLHSITSSNFKAYKEITETIAHRFQELEELRSEQLGLITESFQRLKEALDHQELKLKTELKAQLDEHFGYLSVENKKARQVFSELEPVHSNVCALKDALERSDSSTIVGASKKVSLLQDTYKVLEKKLIVQTPIESFKAMNN